MRIDAILLSVFQMPQQALSSEMNEPYYLQHVYRSKLYNSDLPNVTLYLTIMKELSACRFHIDSSVRVRTCLLTDNEPKQEHQ